MLAAHGDDDGPDAPVDVIGPALRYLLRRGTTRRRRRKAMTSSDSAASTWPGSRCTSPTCSSVPDRTGGGIGRRLLAALFPDPGPADDVRLRRPAGAAALRPRRGWAPWWPNLYVDGAPAGLTAPPPTIAFRAAPTPPSWRCARVVVDRVSTGRRSPVLGEPAGGAAVRRPRRDEPVGDRPRPPPATWRGPLDRARGRRTDRPTRSGRCWRRSSTPPRAAADRRLRRRTEPAAPPAPRRRVPDRRPRHVHGAPRSPSTRPG